MDEIIDISRDYGLKIIEDASQAFGAKYLDKRLGTFGDVGTYSFYATKNLPTGGGMLVTDNEQVYHTARRYRNHGFNDDGLMVSVGVNYNMLWDTAYDGEKYLRLHKPAIESELGRYSEKDGYYSRLVYEHPFYQANKPLWMKLKCTNAERLSSKVRKTG